MSPLLDAILYTFFLALAIRIYATQGEVEQCLSERVSRGVKKIIRMFGGLSAMANPLVGSSLEQGNS